VTDLRTALASSLTVPAGNYTLTGTINIDSHALIGNGVTVHWTPDLTRSSPAFILKGTAPTVTGLTIVGPTKNGAGYDDRVEAQHAFRIDGATHPTIADCTIRNVPGDGIYAGTVGELAHGAWTTDLTVRNATFDEIGRHALTLNAVDRADISGLDVQRVNLAIVDIEPPGHPWGCHNLNWHDSIIRDAGGGFVLADKGVGTSHSVSDIVLDNIVCLRRLFNIQINPSDPNTRRQRFTIRNCVGAGTANVAPLNFRHCDSVTVENVRQVCGRGVALVEQHDCTGVTITGGAI
jgi:hypothetical protein